MLRTIILWVAIAVFAPQVKSAIIWNGPVIAYTQPGTNATLAANQDRLTPNVWLTRGGYKGLFNAALETSYTNNFSPEDTEWAYGELTNYASLSYTNWETWNAGNPPAMVGQDAVAHLISEDIYLSVNFTYWAVRGGTFAYIRSTPNIAPPALHGIQHGGESFLLTFTNTPDCTFTIWGATNLSLAATNWALLGQATDAPPGSGSYQFVDPGATTNQVQRFYRVSWP